MTTNKKYEDLPSTGLQAMVPPIATASSQFLNSRGSILSTKDHMLKIYGTGGLGVK